jgi:type 1 glutamine amidotransferase
MRKKALVVTAGLVHPSILARRLFHEILDGVPSVSCEFITSIEGARRLAAGGYDAVVLYLHRQAVSGEALKALDTFVKGGGGMLAVHSASASFKAHEAYYAILGGRFVKHGRVESFELSRQPGAAAMFGDIERISIKDEFYIHEYDLANQVHFARSTGKDIEPQVWTREYGRGRVFYLAPGHCARTMRNACIKALIARGLLWVCGAEGHA